MKNPTFLEQYNKIVTAYIKDELNPYDRCNCFCGNLFNNLYNWEEVTDEDKFYTYNQIKKLEYNFLSIILKNTITEEYNGQFISIYGSNYINDVDEVRNIIQSHYNYENTLYLAMESTLLMLRELHESKGEVIENYQFNKRELTTT